MKKISKILFVLALALSVGLSYAIVTLKDMPDIFDWENDDE